VTAAATERWAVIDRLLHGVAPIPWSTAEASPEPCDSWAEILVQVTAFAHVRASPACRGFTTYSSGRAGCCCCRWGMSARLQDVGAPGSALFAQAAIARVGQSIALAVGEVARALFEAVLP